MIMFLAPQVAMYGPQKGSAVISKLVGHLCKYFLQVKPAVYGTSAMKRASSNAPACMVGRGRI